ncbi:hypothetical protein ACNKU7_06200 [Microbulbifer sp. SA54]|uniref:hypothetical protein n=1 Tax=Microbulbifer sp. SA54 TaxID=3401577 RepID=UPI003AB045FC
MMRARNQRLHQDGILLEDEQFDVAPHQDDTTALEPLDLTESCGKQEPPETWPLGI